MRIQRITAAAAALLAAFGGGLGLVYYEGSVYDAQCARLLEAARKEGVRVEYVETERRFGTRVFQLTLEEAGEKLHLTGRADFGWGVSAEVSIDQSRGLGALIPESGAAGFRDRTVFGWTPWGGLKPVAVRIEPFRWSDVSADSGPHLRAGAQTLTVDVSEEGTSEVRYEAEGFTLKEGDREVVGIGPVRFDFREEGTVGARLDMTLERVKSAEFSADRTTVSCLLAEEKGNVPKESEAPREGGVLATLEKTPVYRETVEVDVRSPESGGVKNDRFVAKAHLSGLTPEVLERFAALGAGALLGASSPYGASGLEVFGALEALQNAFLTGGLAWELEESRLERNGMAATLTGRLAYDVDPETMSPRLGAFQLSVPEGFVERSAVAVPVAQGRLKLVDGHYVSHIVVTPERITMNGQPVL